MRRALRLLSIALLVVGALALVDGALTLLWKEPLSALYAEVQQRRLDDELAKVADAAPTPEETRELATVKDPRKRLEVRARAAARRVRAGHAFGRLEIPAIDVKAVVVEGTGSADLRSGPGHYPGTPLPGQRGTVAVAGHRTTYGAPFRNVDDLSRGDRITLAMPYGRFSYRVERTRIVPPSATWVTRRVGYDQLVLTACHPLYSAAQRIVIFARAEA